MATIINNPSDTRPVVTDDSPVGMIVGLIVALVLIVLFIMYVVPSFQNASTSAPADTGGTNINVSLPSVPGSNSGGTTGGSAGGTTGGTVKTP